MLSVKIETFFKSLERLVQERQGFKTRKMICRRLQWILFCSHRQVLPPTKSTQTEEAQ